MGFTMDIIQFKDRKGAIIFIIMLTLMLFTSYYIGYQDGEDAGQFNLCEDIGGTLFSVQNEGIVCLNGSLKESTRLIINGDRRSVYGD